MSFGGGPSKPTPATLPPPALRSIEPSVEKAKEDLRERLRKAASRRKSNVTGVGILAPELNIERPFLGQKL